MAPYLPLPWRLPARSRLGEGRGEGGGEGEAHRLHLSSILPHQGGGGLQVIFMVRGRPAGMGHSVENTGPEEDLRSLRQLSCRKIPFPLSPFRDWPCWDLQNTLGV